MDDLIVSKNAEKALAYEEGRKLDVSKVLEESMEQHDVLYQKLATEGVSDELRRPVRS